MKSLNKILTGLWRGQWSVTRLLAGAVSVVVALSFYGCQPATETAKGPTLLYEKLPSALYDEGWRIAGTIPGKRVVYGKRDTWIAVLEFPQKKVTRIILDELSGPYGDDCGTLIGTAWFAYNEKAGVIVCMGHGYYADPDPEQPVDIGPHARDVWIYNLQTKENKWICRNRWNDISNFGWSEDGQKLAFMGTDIPEKPDDSLRRADVYVYDLAKDELMTLADDGAFMRGYMYDCPPIWSEDGKYLYYASIGQDLMRIDMSTGKKERLSRPASVFSLLTVRGREIVYIRRDLNKWHKTFTQEIVALDLESEEGTRARVLYEPIEPQHIVVSPSRRFIFFFDRRGYAGGPRILIDVNTGKTYNTGLGYKYTSAHFKLMSTCPSKGAKQAADSPDSTK